MIDSVGIYKKANNLVQTHGTRNTLILAKESGIDVVPVDCFNDLLGMYSCRWKHRVMFLNDRMDEYLTLMVAGHELGHDAFHREMAKDNGLQEFTLFDVRNHSEYEANAYAAHLLLDDDQVYSLAREGYDVVQMAKIMGSNVNLMLIKMQEMNKLGYDFRIPYNPDSTFFRKIHQ